MLYVRELRESVMLGMMLGGRGGWLPVRDGPGGPSHALKTSEDKRGTGQEARATL